MAVIPYKILQLFRKPKNAEISKRSGVKVEVVDCLKLYPLTLQAILNPHLTFILVKIHTIK